MGLCGEEPTPKVSVFHIVLGIVAIIPPQKVCMTHLFQKLQRSFLLPVFIHY